MRNVFILLSLLLSTIQLKAKEPPKVIFENFIQIDDCDRGGFATFEKLTADVTLIRITVKLSSKDIQVIAKYEKEKLVSLEQIESFLKWDAKKELLIPDEYSVQYLTSYSFKNGKGSLLKTAHTISKKAVTNKPPLSLDEIKRLLIRLQSAKKKEQTSISIREEQK